MRASSQLMRPPLCHCGWSCRRPSVAILACWPLDLICTLRRRGRHDGGGSSDVDEDDDGDDEFMDMASGGWDSSGEESDGGQEGGTLSNGEGRNKGGLNERRGGLGERLVVSNGAGTELYHTARVHTWRRKGRWHERIDTPAGQGALGQRPMTWPWLLDVM